MFKKIQMVQKNTVYNNILAYEKVYNKKSSERNSQKHVKIKIQKYKYEKVQKIVLQ